MAKTVREQFGADIRNARNAAGMTQMDLGAKTGNPQSYISAIEGGRQNLTLDTMVAIARAVGLDFVVITRTLPQER